MNAIVVRELGKREPITPVGLLMVNEDAEVLLHFLVNPFSLSICLWVKGGGCVQCDVEHSVEFFHELGDELWSAVGDDYLGHSMAGVYVVSKDSGPAFS